MPKQKPITDLAEILRRRYVDGSPKTLAHFDRDRLNLRVAQAIYDLRTAAGLTQREVAESVGTTPSVISRLEDADYRGHSLPMLQRVAEALGQELQVHFVPKRPTHAGRFVHLTK